MRCPTVVTIGTRIGAGDDYDELLWCVREASGFVEQTIAWGDESERLFWRAVLEGLLSGPHYASHYAGIRAAGAPR